MRTILCLSFFIYALGADELRVNRGILPGGMIDDKKLLLHEEIFGDENLCAARREHPGNRGQDVSKNKE